MAVCVDAMHMRPPCWWGPLLKEDLYLHAENASRLPQRNIISFA